MTHPIVSSRNPITLIGGADVAPDVLKAALMRAETVVCADGGADTALWSELQPQAVIGDMDSISGAARDAYADVLHPIAEQDTTDFDKALRSIEAPLILGVGFLGDRFDHGLAVMHVLHKFMDKAVVLLGAHDVVFMAPSRLKLKLPVGTRVSLLPIAPVQVSTEGLKWDVDGETMSLDHFIGSSNQAEAETVNIRSTGGLAVIVPPSALDVVLEAVQAAVHAK